MGRSQVPDPQRATKSLHCEFPSPWMKDFNDKRKSLKLNASLGCPEHYLLLDTIHILGRRTSIVSLVYQLPMTVATNKISFEQPNLFSYRPVNQKSHYSKIKNVLRTGSSHSMGNGFLAFFSPWKPFVFLCWWPILCLAPTSCLSLTSAGKAPFASL